MKKSIHILFCLSLFFCDIHSIDLSRYRFHTIPATHYYHGIMGITKDSIGRIWYNGRDALFMYDGNAFNQMDPYLTPLFPRTSWVYKTVFTDKNKRLFVVTNQGLLSFNYNTFQFNQLIDGDVNNAIVQEDDGLIWILRNNRIESFYYEEKPQLKSHPFPSDKGLSGLSHINGYVYFADNDGKIYRLNRKMEKPEFVTTLNENIRYMRQMIGYGDDFFVLTNPGLYRLDKSGKVKKEYKINNETLSDLKCLYVDELGIVWVATQNGLLLIDPQTDNCSLLQSKPGDIHSLPHNSIWSIYPDPDGGIWIGTFGGKLIYMNFIENPVTYKTHICGQLNNSIVSCFEEDETGNLWIGTEGGGLNYWNRKNDTFSYYTHSNSNGINYDLIKALSFDAGRKKLKVAAYNGGIVELNTHTGKFKDINLYDPNNHPQKLSVYDFSLEADSGIWIANPEEILYYKNLKKGTVRQIALINTDGTILNDIAIECLCRDENEKLWLFSRRGIFVMNVNSQKIEKQYYIKDMPYFVNNLICYEWTSNSELWVGTMGGGINVLTSDGIYKNISSPQGFPPKIVFGIKEDPSSGNIWMSTDDGVYYYERKTDSCKKADIFDSDMFGSFYPKSSFRTSSGEIVFGGTKGFILFNPQEIRQNSREPKVFFTHFIINNNEIKPENSNILKNDISVMGSETHSLIKLTYKQSHIRICFSSNSYLNASKNKFSYRL
ncbi:MAG: hybrid sensor histidine kinase/response regulator, partial [Dysgonamonadaceae bacterium]|nr:hybrid sensor histidine kinase/response regulator [Dysgonamonadaceae bacterium]